MIELPTTRLVEPGGLARVAAWLRDLRPGLSRDIWTLELGVFVNAFGTGMLMPFTVIYLHDARGFALPTAGLVLTAYGGLGLVGALLAGSAVDRVGPRATLAVSLLLLAAGYGLMPTVRAPWQAFLYMTVAGFGNGAMWPGQSAILASLAGRERRSTAYATHRAVGNLGVGLGAFAAGFVAVAARPGTFTVLFVADAATFVAYLTLLPRLRTERTEKAAAAAAPAGWLPVLRDLPLLGVIGLNVVYTVAGYMLLEIALPVFAHDEAGLAERAIGTVFLVNTCVIAVAQLPIARALQGRRRMRALAGMTVLWAAAWATVFVAADLGSARVAAVAFVLAAAVFAVGECALGPAQSALVADLAPSHLRGRYLALLTTSTAAGFFAGPAAVGWLLSVWPRAVWPLGAAVLLLAGAGAVLLERRLPEHARVTPRRPAGS